MKIGPVDIRNHSFSKRKVRGVDEGEVAAFLELVAERMEEILLDQEDLHGKIARLEQELGDYRDLDRSLRDSLVSAERLSDGRLEQAERESRIILKNAEVEGEKLIGAAREEVRSVRASLNDLRRQRVTYIERFRALLRSQLKILEASVDNYAPDLDDVERTLDAIDARPGAGADVAAGSPSVPTALPQDTPPVSESTEWKASENQPGVSSTTPPGSYLGEEGLFSRAGDAARIEED